MGILSKIGAGIKKLFTWKITDKLPPETKVHAGTVPIGPAFGALGAAGTKVGSVAKSVVKSFIPATTKGKALAATGTLIGYGVVKESPKAKAYVKEKALATPQLPGKIVGVGEDIGKAIEGKTVLTKENVVKAAKVAGVAGVIATGAAIAIPKIKEKLQDKESPIIPVAAAPVLTTPDPTNQIIKEKEMGIKDEKPITPETTTIQTGKRRYKRFSAKKKPSVRQSVRVNVINQNMNLNKRFIKEVVLT